MQELLSILIKIFFYLILAAGSALILYLLYKLIRGKPKLTISEDCCILSVAVPKENEKSPLAAEQFFASLHGIYRTAKEQIASETAQEHVSFELVSSEKYLHFYIHTPKILKDFVEGQIYAQYPKVDIKEVEDYSKGVEERKNLHFAAAELIVTKEDVYPIKTFVNFDVDPLAAITSVLSKVTAPEQIWIQILVRPVDDSWQNKGIDYVEKIKASTTVTPSLLGGLSSGVKQLSKDLFKAAINPEAMAENAKAVSSAAEPEVELPGPVKAGIEGIETKITKLGFATKIRLIALAQDESTARGKLQAVAGAFKQFNTTNLNGFAISEIKIDDQELLLDFRARMFDLEDPGFIFNIEELASIYHLPNVSVETPTIVWTGSKKGEPPANLPIVGSVTSRDLSPFAKTDFRNNTITFGIKNLDRRHHMYTIGKTGTGKTTMLENMAIADIREGKGVAIVDPHGDFVDRVLDFIPPERIKDVVVFNPADRKYPIGFNLLESVDPDMKNIVTSGLIGIFQKIWAFTWGPRLEHILRNTILALLDYPGSTLLGVLKMLVDENFRKRVINQVKDPVIKEFWEKEFTGYNERLRSEAISPIQNKVGQFVSSSTIRNIIGQTKSTIDMHDILDNGKILLVNLAKGKIGEDNSALLGAMIITKIQLAAMQRAYVPESERQDFYLYVDEFQNFATESFATIFSEARKYHLNIIVANQYITQMPEEVREAVFGNVGTIISFRVGASDSPYLAKEYAPVFEEQDLVNLDIFHIYIKMAIDGITSSAFSAITLPPAHEAYGLRERVVEQSRQKYGRSVEEVERAIIEWSERESTPVTLKEGKVRDFTKPERKTKGPSGVMQIGNDRFEEYVHWDGKKWYQKIKEEKPLPPSVPPKPPQSDQGNEDENIEYDLYDQHNQAINLLSQNSPEKASRSILNPAWQVGIDPSKISHNPSPKALKRQLKPNAVNPELSRRVNLSVSQSQDRQEVEKKSSDIIDITNLEGRNISI
jgi:hypothetical protein